MAVRNGPVTVDSKIIVTAGTPLALTADEVRCTSVYIIGAEANTGTNVYIVDSWQDLGDPAR